MAMSLQKQPLVEGDHRKPPEKLRLPSSFTCSTIPCVYDNTIILAATHPTVATAGPIDDAPFISDFYAFNYFLKGKGMEQVWLTAADPNRLVEKYGPYLHGYEEEKVCLDGDMLRQNELTDVIVVRSSEMIDRFLSEAKRASELAKKTDAPLLILIFCHGLPNHRFFLDDGDREMGISLLALKSVLEPGVCITLVTTAWHSRRWVVTPELNTTALKAAGYSAENNSGLPTNADWTASTSIARTCGSIFASTMVKALSSSSGISPLLNNCDESVVRKRRIEEDLIFKFCIALSTPSRRSFKVTRTSTSFAAASYPSESSSLNTQSQLEYL